jgi:hypothetical protein
MTHRAKKKLQSKMRRTWKKAVAARRKHERMLKSYKRMQRQYRAA